MNQQGPAKDRIGDAFRHPEIITAALEQAFYKAVRSHRESGVDMVFWENGKITHVSAFDVPLPEDPPKSAGPAH